MAPVTPTYLVGCDNRDDTRVFSGSTYHLARQGIQDGVLTAMLNLYPRGLAGVSTYVRAALWKMQGGWHGRHGFKFTDFFLDPGWKRCLPSLSGAVVVNNFQLFGSHFVHSHDKFGIRPYFYIDGTLEEYFQNYMQYDTSIVDKGAMASAMAAERDGYAACLKVIAMSRRTAELLTQNYRVPRTKIYIVPPGANIPEDRLEQFDQNSSGRLRRRGNPRSLTLGFIGLYPERKGLPTIAAAVGLLRRAGYDVRLHVIGKCPASIAEQDGVTYFGMIDKRTGLDRLIDIVSKIDLGCMLSRAELTGIALLEFLRLGIPIIATDVGGIPDILELGAGELVSSASSEEYLASLLSGLIDEPERLQALKETAWQRRHNASWRRVVRELGKVVQS